MQGGRLTVTVTAVVALSSLVLVACGGDEGPDAGSQPPPSHERASTTTARPTTPTTVAAATALDVATAPWTLPAPTSRAVALFDAGALVLLGGQDASHASVATVISIDPVSGTPASRSPLDPAVHDAAGVQVGDDSVVIAGGTPPARAVVQANPASGPTRPLGELAAPRTDHVAALVDQTIFVLGGAGADERAIPTVESSPDGATWSDAGVLAEAVRYPAVAVFDRAVYLFGGVPDDGPDTTAVQRYDPATRTTEVVARLPSPLSHASAVVLGGQVWVLGGFVDDTPSAQVLRFDPASGNVSDAGSLPGPVTDAAVVATSPRTGLLVGGEGPGRVTTDVVVGLRAR